MNFNDLITDEKVIDFGWIKWPKPPITPTYSTPPDEM